MSLRENFGKKSVHRENFRNSGVVFRPFFVPSHKSPQPYFCEKTPKNSVCFSGCFFLHFLHFFAIFFANLWHFRKKNVRKCPDFPPKFPEGTLLRRAVSVKIMFFRGRISRISRNCTNFSRKFPGISGIFPKSTQKWPFFTDVYKRLQPENTKKPRIFPRDFPGIFREFPEFPEIFRNFPGISQNSR